MYNNIIDKIYKDTNYNQYMFLDYIYLTTFTSSLIFQLATLESYQELLPVFLPIELMSLTPIIINRKTKAVLHTKDIKELKALYDEIIMNYTKLNNTFNLDNPLEIYTMYDYALNNGYLSKNKTFHGTVENIFDIKELNGVNIFNGYGVCRHISPLLNDIYTSLNKENNQMIVNYNYDDPTIQLYINKLNSPYTTEKEKEVIKKVLKLTKKEKRDLLSKLGGNHVINVVEEKNIVYYIDPTNQEILKRLGRILITEENEEMIINKFGNLTYSGLKELMKIEKIKAKRQTEFEEDKKIMNDTKEIIQKNKDILEKFYLENNDIYNDISSKILTLTKK